MERAEERSGDRMAIRGVVAGAIATVAMSGVMLAARRVGLMGKLPPEKITEKALDALDVPSPAPVVKASTAAAHFGYGMASGAIYGGLLQGRVLRKHPVLEGIAFGGIVWAASYFGWVPALGIMPPPTRDQPGRPLSMLTAHVVFGGLLGSLTPKALPDAAAR